MIFSSQIKNKLFSSQLFVILLSVVLQSCSSHSTKIEKSTGITSNPSKEIKISINLSLEYKNSLDKLRNGSEQDGLASLEVLANQYPTASGPYANIGLVYLQQGKLDKAEEYLLKSIIRNNSNKQAHNYLGIIYRKKGKFESAKKEYLKAIQIDHNYSEAHKNMGILYDLYLQKPEVAVKHYAIYKNTTDGDGKKVSVWITDLNRRIARRQIAKGE